MRNMTQYIQEFLRKFLRIALIAFMALSVTACSTTPKMQGSEPTPPFFDGKRLLDDDTMTVSSQINDPWEGFNRTMYSFNYRVDRYVLLPVVKGYQYVTPEFAQTGIHNFFTNIWEIPTLYNSIFQLSFTKSYQSAGRLITNTTVGLAGFLDAATYFGIPKHQEDFGQTLGYWGTGSGPFLVLPLFGPSSVRDGFGLGVDSVVMSTLQKQLDLEMYQELAIGVLKIIDTRSNVSFRYYETGSPFEYRMVRGLWLTKRKMDIEK
jgi:phospholipid-binding lipoprotein MlaA